ncbi:MAG: hypothetical protein GY786_05140 [Proteobacteria bacterium]|nr:hypothetical protein [Pseudomonadota bacterium]
MDDEYKGSRRGFFLGLLATVGTATVALAASRFPKIKKQQKEDIGASSGPVLYKRSKEAERYYNTLYN